MMFQDLRAAGPFFYDPNAPFDAQAEQLKRKQAMADAIVQQAMQQLGQQPEGRMVGGRWIPPDASQAIQGAFGMYGGLGMGKEAGKQTAAMRAAEQQAAAEHIANLPTDKQVPFAAPFMEGEEPAPTGNFDVQKATPADKIKWAQAGMAIPSLRGTLEKVMADQLVEEPVRAENRAFRADEAAAARQERIDRYSADRTLREELQRATLEQRQREAQLRSEDTRATLEQRREAAREALALRRELAEMNAAVRREVAAARGQTSEGQRLPPKVVDDLSEGQESVAALSNLRDQFRPEYGGIRGGIESVTGRFKDDAGGPSAKWWTDYRRQAELVERHALFGASLTGGEQEAWRKANIQPGMDPKQIQANLQTRAELAKKIFDKKVNNYGASGYNVNAFKEPGDNRTDIKVNSSHPKPAGGVVNFGDLK